MSKPKKNIIYVGGSTNRPKILGRKFRWDPPGPSYARLVSLEEWKVVAELVRPVDKKGKPIRNKDGNLQYEVRMIGPRGGITVLGNKPCLSSAKDLVEQELVKRFKAEDADKGK